MNSSSKIGAVPKPLGTFCAGMLPTPVGGIVPALEPDDPEQATRNIAMPRAEKRSNCRTENSDIVFSPVIGVTRYRDQNGLSSEQDNFRLQSIRI